MKIPANDQFFLWLVSHNSVPTRSILNNIGIRVVPNCPICDLEHETLVHCLFTCNRAKVVWRLVMGSNHVISMGDTFG